MLKEEGVVEISILKRQGYSIRGIARELGISRNTVREYLRTGKKAVYSSRPASVRSSSAIISAVCCPSAGAAVSISSGSAIGFLTKRMSRPDPVFTVEKAWYSSDSVLSAILFTFSITVQGMEASSSLSCQYSELFRTSTLCKIAEVRPGPINASILDTSSTPGNIPFCSTGQEKLACGTLTLLYALALFGRFSRSV